jgi:hypothetical protein
MAISILGWAIPAQKYLSTVELKRPDRINEEDWEMIVPFIKQNKTDEITDNVILDQIYDNVVLEFCNDHPKNVLDLTDKERSYLWVSMVSKVNEYYSKTEKMLCIGISIDGSSLTELEEHIKHIKEIEPKLKHLVRENSIQVFSDPI